MLGLFTLNFNNENKEFQFDCECNLYEGNLKDIWLM